MGEKSDDPPEGGLDEGSVMTSAFCGVHNQFSTPEKAIDYVCIKK